VFVAVSDGKNGCVVYELLIYVKISLDCCQDMLFRFGKGF